MRLEPESASRRLQLYVAVANVARCVCMLGWGVSLLLSNLRYENNRNSGGGGGETQTCER